MKLDCCSLYCLSSTSLISFKLFACYWAARSQIKDTIVEPTVDYHEILQRLAGCQEMIFPRCKIVREADTVHCPVSKKCIAGY